uniref:MYND-type domain-containing protein n=1 Tax=Hippocampus comes TaxID=109280 RepID=A0A3Q2YK01_HIPCM
MKPRSASPNREGGEVPRQGFGVQEFLDGSKYEGDFVNGLKHGKGRYTWKSGEFYEGSFYKDYRHGDGMYCWPTGNKFVGKFYLNWREGYGEHIFPDGYCSPFQGLYHADQRFGPGVLSEPTGCQDVGLWHGKHLIQLCNSVQSSFSLKNLTEYAAYLEQNIFSHSQCQVPCELGSDAYLQFCPRVYLQVDTDESWLLHDRNNALPCGIENYSTDGDHLPLPPGRRREFDEHFYGELWEPDSHGYEGYKREPHASLPLQARLLDMSSYLFLSMERDRFGPKGHLEVTSELLIHQASVGKGPAILEILLDGLIHPDVADSQGHTALIAATVNCHNDVVQLLLDLGADIDKVNSEGMSALAVCHVLYYPFQSLYTFDGLISKTQVTTQDTNKNNPARCFDSACCMYSYGIHVTERVLQGAAEALSHAWFQQHSGETEETVRKMAAMKHRVRLTTLNLLLDRGADPNTSRVPLPVIFLAILAADTKTVRKHLLCGAQTDISLPPERKGLYPLHVAAALPGLEGPEITKLLLHALTDPDARACDHDDIYEPDKVCRKPLPGSTITRKSWRVSEKPRPKEGGRTALHIACQRDSDYCVVSLLLSYKASTDLLWSGHSPLSLAIASGNNTAVEELLKGGVDPNLPLGRGVGSALCALGNFNYRLDANRPKLVLVFLKCDSGIAHTPYHALSMEGRETFKIQRQLLSMMGITKLFALLIQFLYLLLMSTELFLRSPFKFCYHCGRSAAVKLTACTRCHKVFYCSMACKLIAWDERHKEDHWINAGFVPPIGHSAYRLGRALRLSC